MASTFVPIAIAARSKSSNSRQSGHTSRGYHTSIGLKPYTSDLTNDQITKKWAEPLAQEELLKTHPVMNMIEEKVAASVAVNLSKFEEEERARINGLSEAELKSIKKQYVPTSTLLNRAKKGTLRAFGARTQNNSRNELLAFALSRYLPNAVRDMRANLKVQYRNEEVANLSPKMKEIYAAEVDYKKHINAGDRRVTTGPGSTTYEWVDDAEIASRMANAGISGWGGRRTLRKRKIRRN
jgi:hypothetical protein